ncbi:hypothetical protein [Halomonas organivorans]|uniref:Uncharacterized protein n=1 Tax=Halomonas organivorans TaxID=257772 RepID=A0A7W5C071_9GAMM|nr:hypothetical protein [Halomonas organivorans]MBB3142216.1 hypothetical protein [Halomonas organivorans]
MRRLKEWWKRWKAKHWEKDIEVIDDSQIIGFFPVVPPLRARWEAIRPHLKRWTPDVAVGVLAGIITTLILRLFGL